VVAAIDALDIVVEMVQAVVVNHGGLVDLAVLVVHVPVVVAIVEVVRVVFVVLDAVKDKVGEIKVNER